MDTTAAQELVIARTFDAPRELVWKAWTEQERLDKWWGPKGFLMKTAKLELKPGGVFHYSMQSPDGKVMWGKFVFREIRAPEKLVYVNMFSDAQGNATRNPWLPVWPLEILNTLTLEEKDGQTLLTIRGGPINATQEEIDAFLKNRPGMQQGFAGTFAQLDEYLKTMSR